MQANHLIQSSPHQAFITKTIHMRAGYIDDFHTHPWHQIIFPLSGLLQSSIENKSVIVPHNAMLYIPADTVHKSVSVTDTQFLAMYLNPKSGVNYGVEAKSCLVTPFLKALILLLFNRSTQALPPENLIHLLTVLRDQIDTAGQYAIPLLIPRDKRLKAIFDQLTAQPDVKFSLNEWAKHVGASERTLSRLCAKEFDQSFSLWRQNVRLVLSLQLLSTPRTIQDIALELGYASDSAYIYAFKKLFHNTPSKYRHSLLNHGQDLTQLVAEGRIDEEMVDEEVLDEGI
ncbi:helix-turn-helix transcriptional regulator [Vibrio furnissii]|uniref:helix-turn-helix transcriptional regulator n=1 Tax=Vibrio furnissii TaxID=29494 RepID=UPI001302E7AB|nr:AraC family transcriptional regulator [Vibrio furnissii]